MFCSQCGKQLPDGAKFCSACGKKLNAQPPQPTPVRQDPVPPQPASEPTEPVNQQEPFNPKPPLISREPISRRPGPASEPSANQKPPAVPQVPVPPPVPPRPPVSETPPKTVVQRIPAPARGGPSGLQRFLAVVLCILLLAAGLAASLLGALRWNLNPDSLYYQVVDADLAGTKMPDADGNAVPLARYIPQVCEIDFVEEYGIDEAGLERLLGADFLKRYLADNLANYTDTLFNGVPLKPLTRNGLVNFMRSRDGEIRELTGFSFIQYEYAGQLDRVNEYLDVYSMDGIFDSIGTRSIDERFLEEDVGLDLPLLQTFFSLWFLLALCGLCLLLLVLIFVTLRRSRSGGFGAAGTTLLILSILDLLLGAGGLFGLKIAKLGTIEAIVSPTLFALLVLGGVLLLAAVVLLILKGKRKNRAAAQAA